jgi:hypothetical protein
LGSGFFGALSSTLASGSVIFPSSSSPSGGFSSSGSSPSGTSSLYFFIISSGFPFKGFVYEFLKSSS